MGIKARVEEKYQKLLSEPLVKLVINYIKLWSETNAQSWQSLMDFYESTIRDENIDDNFISENLDILSGQIFLLSSISQLVDYIIGLLGESNIKK